MPDLFRRLTVSGQVRHWGPLQCGTVPAETLCGRWVVPSAARSCIGTAGYQHMDQIQLHPTVYQETGLLVSESVRSMGGILVNAEGKRFCNDLATRDAVSNAELEQPGAYAYIIFDQRIVDDLKSCQKYIKNGLTVSADNYEDDVAVDEARKSGLDIQHAGNDQTDTDDHGRYAEGDLLKHEHDDREEKKE